MAPRKVLITGAGGCLGRYCTESFARQYEVRPVSHGELDVTSAFDVDQCLAEIGPALVINCAAMTNVDGCERAPAEAEAVNVTGPCHLARACERAGAALVHVSTDFVFDGVKSEPYTILDQPHPISRYGDTKWRGEEEVRRVCERHFIVRSSRVFGSGGRNFLSTLIGVAKRDGRLLGITDETSIPTYAADLADRIGDVVRLDRYGTYHVTNQGACSWLEVARAALGLAGIDQVELVPVRSADLKRPAIRPRYSVMRCLISEELGLQALRDWREAYGDFLKECGSSP